MPKPKGYGISGEGLKEFKYQQGRETDKAGSTTDLLDENGNIVNQAVHSVAKEVSEEYFCDDVAAAEALVTSGQFGKEVNRQVRITEKNTDFCKFTVTKRILPDYKEEEA